MAEPSADTWDTWQVAEVAEPGADTWDTWQVAEVAQPSADSWEGWPADATTASAEANAWSTTSRLGSSKCPHRHAIRRGYSALFHGVSVLWSMFLDVSLILFRKNTKFTSPMECQGMGSHHGGGLYITEDYYGSPKTVNVLKKHTLIPCSKCQEQLGKTGRVGRWHVRTRFWLHWRWAGLMAQRFWWVVIFSNGVR